MPIQRVEFGERDLARIFKSEPKISWKTRTKGLLRSLLASGLTVGILFFGLNWPAYRQRLTYQLVGPPASNNQPAALTLPQPAPEAPVAPRAPELFIGKIGSLAPIIYDIALDQIVPNLRQGVVHLAGTAKPGEIGNSVIFGHSSDVPWAKNNYRTIFALLDQLETGDKIETVYRNAVFRYTVTDRQVVKPTAIAVLDPTDQPILTLISCYPVGTTTNRIIVRALLDQAPTGQNQTPVNLVSLPAVR